MAREECARGFAAHGECAQCLPPTGREPRAWCLWGVRPAFGGPWGVPVVLGGPGGGGGGGCTLCLVACGECARCSAACGECAQRLAAHGECAQSLAARGECAQHLAACGKCAQPCGLRGMHPVHLPYAGALRTSWHNPLIPAALSFAGGLLVIWGDVHYN